jgi:hypothetical protein
LKGCQFKNLIRYVRGWGVLRSLDHSNPTYPTLSEILTIQRQTRADRIEQARVLLEIVLEKAMEKDKTNTEE